MALFAADVCDLERTGDHADSLAEFVVYLLKGLDIRHIDANTLDEAALKGKG